jgi:stress response protein YsnF
MSKTVIGLMDNIGEAQSVVKDLVASGIDRDDIGFMANQKHAVPESAGLNEGEGSRAASGALAGAGTGAALGGVAGLALALAPLAIPGIGPILAAGPIAAALTGAGIGAVAGGLIGGLTKLGVPESEAHYYAEGVRRGGILVTVAAESDAQAQTAVTVMQRHGAVDIDQRATEWKKQGWKGRFDADVAQSATERTETERTIPATQEELVVGKRNVQQGGVRVFSRVIDRPASGTTFREQSFELRESAEEPVVEKRARVAKEVKVGKKKSKSKQTVQDTVRTTDVEVERTGASNQSRYRGPERRVKSTPYLGAERRRAA